MGEPFFFLAPLLQETVQSLRFGEMCSAVEHENAESGKDAGVAVREALSRIDAEIKDLETQILQKEHWMWKKTTRLHIVDEMDDEMVVCNKDEEMELGGRGIRAVLSAKPVLSSKSLKKS